jgi:opacity protein-like surface antigen
MNAKHGLHGWIVAITTVLLVVSRAALADTASRDLQIYAGEIFGDRLTSIPLTGRYPVLNDNATVGGRYTYGLSRWFAVQLEAGYSPGRAARLAVGDSNLGVTTADLDILFNLAPALTMGGRRVVLYTELGAGYAWIDLHQPLLGSTASTPVMLTGRNDYSVNIGLGAQYYLTTKFFVDFDARYRYVSRLVNRYNQELNTAETTLGIGYAF